MVEEMKIQKKLKDRVERFLSYYYMHEKEMGGYLLKNRKGNITDFLPVPNVSDKPRTTFRESQGSKELAEQYARSRQMTIEAFFHSHPEPCIMSTGDLCYVQSYPDLTFVTITSTGNYKKNSRGKEYIWYACQGIKPVKIEEVSSRARG